MTQKIILIIPAYNEEKTIEKTIHLISQTGYDYIVINDGSTDKTSAILKKLKCPHINLLYNLGIGGAVQTGYKYAKLHNYDIAIQFDADGQHDTKYLQDLISPIINHEANLVIGSCFIDKSTKSQRSSALRRFGIHFLSNVIKLFSNKRIHDPTSGFRAADKAVISDFSNNYPLEYPEPVSNFEALCSPHIIVKEIPVKMNKRMGGKSSISSWKIIYAGLNVLLSIIILNIRKKKYD